MVGTFPLAQCRRKLKSVCGKIEQCSKGLGVPERELKWEVSTFCGVCYTEKKVCCTPTLPATCLCSEGEDKIFASRKQCDLIHVFLGGDWNTVNVFVVDFGHN